MEALNNSLEYDLIVYFETKLKRKLIDKEKELITFIIQQSQNVSSD